MEGRVGAVGTPGYKIGILRCEVVRPACTSRQSPIIHHSSREALAVRLIAIVPFRRLLCAPALLCCLLCVSYPLFIYLYVFDSYTVSLSTESSPI